MTNWKEYKLGEIGVVITGKTPSSKNPEQWGIEMPFVTPTDFDTYNKNITSSIRYLSGAGIKAFENKVLPKDSIIVTCIGSQMGKVAINKIECVTNQQINSIIPFNKFNSDFIYYVLSSMQEYLRNLATGGSTMPIVNKSSFEDIIISIPDLPTQTAIAEILSSLDDKIELNNKINQELENLAQTLFKQWFIDFEFPNENGEPYKSSGGEMVESELGEIPRALSICKISDLRPKLETGKRPKGGVKGIESGMPSVGAESIKGVGYFDYTKTKYVPFEYATNMRRGIVSGFELLIYKDGGKPGTFIPHFGMFGEGYPFDEFVINEHVFLLDFGNKDYNCFSYFFFDSPYVKPILENSGGKAAIPGINQGDINNLSIFHPSNPLVKKFQEIAHCCISTILINCKENTYLTNLRDTLLPKLISGELEVSKALTQTTV
jgi:type I restriction enzyme S subunit